MTISSPRYLTQSLSTRQFSPDNQRITKAKALFRAFGSKELKNLSKSLLNPADQDMFKTPYQDKVSKGYQTQRNSASRIGKGI